MSPRFPWWLSFALGWIACGDRAVPLSPPEAYDEALAALEENQLAEAERRFDAMVRDDPADPLPRAGLARALAHQGRLAEAIIQDKLAYALDPRLAEVAYNVACSYSRLGERELALRWLDRAHDGGVRDLNLIEQDPDLDGLRGDHRFAFFLATGALSLEEREAVVRVTPALVSPDQQARVDVTVVSLNRPLMAAPERLELRFTGELPDGTLAPVSRVERFEAGESGGREFFRRELAFTYEARAPAEVVFGPFELSLGGEELPVRPAWLSVREVLPDLFARRATEGEDDVPPDAAAWFASPGTLSEGVDHPFVRWDGRDLVMGVELLTDGVEVPDRLTVALGDAACTEAWSEPRLTAFLRTRAEGASRIWFHRRSGHDAGVPPPGCPDPLPVRVILGDEILFETEIAWP